ncbi:chromosome partitioning protein [Mycolicibacterium sp.]|uniref:MinD/ParA family ATP-binding protein n=1 Tax=Mycolicibacterium sp. TaxID=2320850 RepID=UPI0037C6277F
MTDQGKNAHAVPPRRNGDTSAASPEAWPDTAGNQMSQQHSSKPATGGAASLPHARPDQPLQPPQWKAAPPSGSPAPQALSGNEPRHASGQYADDSTGERQRPPHEPPAVSSTDESPAAETFFDHFGSDAPSTDPNPVVNKEADDSQPDGVESPDAAAPLEHTDPPVRSYDDPTIIHTGPVPGLAEALQAQREAQQRAQRHDAQPDGWGTDQRRIAQPPAAGWAQGPQQYRAPAPHQAHPGYAPGPAGQQHQWGYSPAAAAHHDWTYVDQIRPSELVPTRKREPKHGWRRAVYAMTFGVINPGPSADERRLAELEGKIRTPLRGTYKIGVVGKGGVGKSTVAAGVGSVLAELRQDDRVIAIDADTAFGKLGSRVDTKAASSYWELIADNNLSSFADVRARVGSNEQGLFVLPGEASTSRRRILDPRTYRNAANRLDRHFSISIVDCGSSMDADVTREVLTDLNALIVVSSPWLDGASAAAQTMDLLGNNGFTALLNHTVVVLNDSDGNVDRRARSVLVESFSKRGQAVVELPFDRHLRPGGVVDISTNGVDKTTRRRFIEITAKIAEHFAETADGPRSLR